MIAVLLLAAGLLCASAQPLTAGPTCRTADEGAVESRAIRHVPAAGPLHASRASARMDVGPHPSSPAVPVAYVREDGGIAPQTDSLTVSGLRVRAGERLFVPDGVALTLLGDLVVEAGGALDLDGATLRFGPDAALVVYGDMRADEAALVAVDPYAGWRGVRIEAGGAGAARPVRWTRTVVETVTVADGRPAAVVVTGRAFEMDIGRITFTRGGSGLLVTSGTAHLAQVYATNNEGYGLVADAGGTLTLTRQGVVANNGAGGLLAVGTGARVEADAVEVRDNLGPSVEARAGGVVSVTRSWAEDNGEPARADGGVLLGIDAAGRFRDDSRLSP